MRILSGWKAGTVEECRICFRRRVCYSVAMPVKVVNADWLWRKVQREDAARRRGDRKALAEGRVTPEELRNRNFWFPGRIRFVNLPEANRALIRCLRRETRAR